MVRIATPMTNQDIERLRTEHETRVWRTFLWACGLCLCAVILPLLSMLGCGGSSPSRIIAAG